MQSDETGRSCVQISVRRPVQRVPTRPGSFQCGDKCVVPVGGPTGDNEPVLVQDAVERGNLGVGGDMVDISLGSARRWTPLHNASMPGDLELNLARPTWPLALVAARIWIIGRGIEDGD